MSNRDSSEELVVVSRFLGTSLGEAELEIAGWLGDWFRTRRLRSVAKTIKKTQQVLAEAGVEPTDIPLKTLSSLLDGASMEDENDEAMIDRWANMLARAAVEPEAVPPMFPQLLKELTPQQAAALEEMALAPDQGEADGYIPLSIRARVLLGRSRVPSEVHRVPMPRLSRAAVVDLRERGLVRSEERAGAAATGDVPSYGRLTELGWVLIDLCAPPADENLDPRDSGEASGSPK